jgi:hypothetical protein
MQQVTQQVATLISFDEHGAAGSLALAKAIACKPHGMAWAGAPTTTQHAVAHPHADERQVQSTFAGRDSCRRRHKKISTCMVHQLVHNPCMQGVAYNQAVEDAFATMLTSVISHHAHHHSGHYT